MNCTLKASSHREQTCGCQVGRWERDGVGVWDEQMQTSIYRVDKQQVLLQSAENYIQYSVINHNGKEYEKEYIYSINILYICIYVYSVTESLCYTSETNTTL